MVENFHFRQQLGTIVDPSNKHTIVDQGCLWNTPEGIDVIHSLGGEQKKIYIFAPPSSPNERTLNQKKLNKNISPPKKGNQREIIDFMPCIAQISSYVFCGPWWRPFLNIKVTPPLNFTVKWEDQQRQLGNIKVQPP